MVLMAIRCTYPACSCDSFAPSKSQVRLCQGCKHGWVAHALDKLAASYNYGPQVEPVSPNVAFDVASLMLYGSQAVPIRLKILLDRLFSVLPHDEVLQVLHGFGWSHEDYARGYILVDSAGRMLDKWTVINKDEEYIVVQQFLRFAETRTLAQEIILQETRTNQEFARLPPRTESDIKKFIERNNLAIMQSYNLTVRRAFESQQPVTSQLFAGLPGFAPHLASLHHAAAAAAAAAAGFPPTGMSHTAASPILLGLKQESGAAAAAAAAESAPSPKAGGGGGSSGATPPAPAASGSGRPRVPEPFDLRTKTPDSSAARSPPASSHSSPVSSLASAAAATGSVANSFALGAQAMPSGLKVDAYGLPPSAVTMRPSDFASYVEEGAINLSKDAPFSSRHHAGSSIGAVASPKAHLGSLSTASGSGPRHRHHQPLPASSVAAAAASSSRTLSVGGGWPYGASFGSAVFVGASGKKRVLCTACNKTFCDKGALKIHYSAVHLKEMHRCTIPGCTMMFSSRRSRNRHSANPNPKLHTPQTPRRPRERLLDVGGSSGGGGSLSNSHHHHQHHRHAVGGSSGNLSQTPSAPNSDDEDSCGGGGGIGGLEDDEVMDVTGADDDIDDVDDDEACAYYGDSTQGSSTDGQQLLAAAMAGARHGSSGVRMAASVDNNDDDGDEDDMDEYGSEEAERCRRSPHLARRPLPSAATVATPPQQQHLRSNKRKCLMPTRVAAAVSAEAFHSENDERTDGLDERRGDGSGGGSGAAAAVDGGELDSPSTDSCSSFAGHQGRTVIVKPEPTETPPSDVDMCDPQQQRRGCGSDGKSAGGERIDHRGGLLGMPLPSRFHLGDIEAKQQQQQSALQALFSSFLPRGGDPVSAAAVAAAYWPSRLHSMAAAMAESSRCREPGECGDAGRGQHCSDLSESECSADSREAPPTVGADGDVGVAAGAVDPQSASQCPACSKLFQNQFFMKVHYQNVHLKASSSMALQLPCLINGRRSPAAAVAATFQSKQGGLGKHRQSSDAGSLGSLLATAEPPADVLALRLRPDGAARAARTAAAAAGASVDGEEEDVCGDGPSAAAGMLSERKVNGSVSPAATLRTGGGICENLGDGASTGSCERRMGGKASQGGEAGAAEPVSGASSMSTCAAVLKSPAEVDTCTSNGTGHASQVEKYATVAAGGSSRAIATAVPGSSDGVVQQQSVAV